jgi:hypothetical protein
VKPTWAVLLTVVALAGFVGAIASSCVLNDALHSALASRWCVYDPGLMEIVCSGDWLIVEVLIAFTTACVHPLIWAVLFGFSLSRWRRV